MLTLIDLLSFIIFVTVPIVGAVVGKDIAGPFGAIGGLVVGGFAGYFIARRLNVLLWRISLGPAIRELRKLSVDELKDRVGKPMYALNLNLLELKRRGEDMRQYLPIVVAYLTSEKQHQRVFGLAALRSAYPELTSKIRGYSLRGSVEECKRNTASLSSPETESGNV